MATRHQTIFSFISSSLLPKNPYASPSSLVEISRFLLHRIPDVDHNIAQKPDSAITRCARPEIERFQRYSDFETFNEHVA